MNATFFQWAILFLLFFLALLLFLVWWNMDRIKDQIQESISYWGSSQSETLHRIDEKLSTLSRSVSKVIGELGETRRKVESIESFIPKYEKALNQKLGNITDLLHKIWYQK